MADNESQAVFRREFPLITRRKTAAGTVIGVILRDHRIEIVGRHVSRGSYAKRISFPCVLVLSAGPSCVIGAAEKGKLSVKSWILVLESIDLNHTAHLPAKFRGNTSGIDREGFDVIGFGTLRAKARRTIVGKRNP